MSIHFRNYTNERGYTDDFNKVCDFLIRINKNKVITPNYLWARWVWQFGPYMNMDNLSHIGVYEDNGVIVGLATYESNIGEAYFCLDENYNHLKPQMIDYAIKNLDNNGELKIILPDGDFDYQRIAIQKNFIPTTNKSSIALIDGGNHSYILPNGYHIIDFSDKCFDVERYYNAIWRGFNNQRPKNEHELEFDRNREGFDAPHIDLSLRILIVAPNGDYASHCGMWHIPGSDYSYVEPVFTLPEYRKIGLGKAAVLEGVNRCASNGATKSYVLSSQQFYYNIGFYPVQNETWWTHRK